MSETETREAVVDLAPNAPTARGGADLARWSVAALVELVPGTTRRIWLVELVPMLVAAGVLRKLGRGWFGRRSEIEAALLGRLENRRRR